jgi:transcriptional regulator with XRE-family HTH domain
MCVLPFIFSLTSLYSFAYNSTTMKISEKIKRLRSKKGWTQKQLAKRAGLHLVSIGQIEAEMRIPTLETRKKLAKGLGVKITELLG